MGLELTLPEQDPNAFSAQRVHAVFKRRPASEGGVYEGKGHEGDIKVRRFGEDAQSVGVADAVGPLVYCVERRGGDDGRDGLPIAWYLRPEEQVVMFRSRPELDELWAWCVGDRHAGAQLVTGDGGAGKDPPGAATRGDASRKRVAAVVGPARRRAG